MSEVNLLEEELLLDDKQVAMLAFAIKPQDIKDYIKENKEEYIHWLIQELTKEFWEKYGDSMYQRMKEGIPEFVKNLKSQKYFTKIESLMLKAN